MLIDLHNHTWPLSLDSNMSPSALVERAKKAGLDGICLTEHDWFWAQPAVERLCEQHDFLVLPGVELTTEEGHLLVFGLDSYVFGMHRASFVKESVQRADGAVIAAHPYRRQFKPEGDYGVPAYRDQVLHACDNPALQMSDALEVFNGRASSTENSFSLDVMEHLGMKGLAASDAHDLTDVGACATHFDRRIRNVAELIEELKAGRFHPARFRGGHNGS